MAKNLSFTIVYRRNKNCYLKREKEKSFKRSADWIQQALAEIAKLAPEKKPEIHFSREFSSEDVRYSIRVSDFDRWKSKLLYPTFQEMLMTCIEHKGISNREFYKAALIDRKLFSAIKKNKDYKPKKETAVACCFGLGLDINDAEELLELAGYKLSLSIAWDRVARMI